MCLAAFFFFPFTFNTQTTAIWSFIRVHDISAGASNEDYNRKDCWPTHAWLRAILNQFLQLSSTGNSTYAQKWAVAVIYALNMKGNIFPFPIGKNKSGL